MKQALIFWGGWDGHEPELVANRFGRILREEGFNVQIEEGGGCLDDVEKLRRLDLIVACNTGGPVTEQQTGNVAIAVGAGVGLAGCHGGMCDAFRNDVQWQFMTGGQWVSHPGGDGVEYTVNMRPGSSPIVEGLGDFAVKSEQYYLHVDPAIEVLATTRFPMVNYYNCANKPVDMPVVWTKYWGLGRVFYNSLGHHDDVFDLSPNAEILMRRGMCWAAAGKQYALENNLREDIYLSDKKMY